MTPPDFFDYHCARCDAAYCERVNIMNLVLDYTEDGYCLSCLATEHEMDEPGLVAHLKTYIDSRECFLTPWSGFDPSPCPRLRTQTCYCQDSVAV